MAGFLEAVSIILTSCSLLTSPLPPLYDVDLGVEVIQICWLFCFSDSLKHTPELLHADETGVYVGTRQQQFLNEKTTEDIS